MINLSTILLFLLAAFRKDAAAILDVMVAGKEVQRFLNFDLNTNLVIVKDGRISPLLRSPQFSKVWPTIRADINDLELKFLSPRRVEYVLSLKSSDERIMPLPRANIPLKGRVPRTMTKSPIGQDFVSSFMKCELETRKLFSQTFKIYFPCSGKKTGIVKLFINIQFFDLQSKKRHLPPIHIPLKRECVKGIVNERPNIQPRTEVRKCQKSCDMNSLKTEFCISDFVVRARVERILREKGKTKYYLRVTKRYKRGRIRIRKKHQALEVKGTKLSCKCQKLKVGHVYLIFGREDRRNDTLFIDDYTISMQWGKKCKRFVRTNRRHLNCPPRLAMHARYR